VVKMSEQYKKRRVRLLKQMARGSVAIITTSQVAVRNRDADYAFRPDSNFYYLTGFAESEAVAVLIAPKSGQPAKFILFCRDRDPLREVWDGRRYGQEGAITVFGADEAFSIAEIDERMPGLLENATAIYYPVGKDADFDLQVLAWRSKVMEKVRSGVKAPHNLIAIESLLHEMRLNKDASEIKTMRRAAQISGHAHVRAMQVCQPGMMEYQVEAEIMRSFMESGSRAPAYNSIVAGGENACILHYIENNAELRDGDLLLIDAGAELDCYASDITRTFPVNGCFSREQRAVYEVVLAAQKAAIAQIRPGKRWNAPHDAAVRVLTQGLVDLGILKGSVETLIKEEKYKRFYMHRTGHWLGMDVHDVGEYSIEGKWRSLQPGMVLTVEPGLYIPSDSRGVAKKWWGIGIRIEDDVLVTSKGCEVLTRDAPKEVDEIEALMQKT
jgi:Xaa-Pro aminopeptidase